jgi:hypothetical protein
MRSWVTRSAGLRLKSLMGSMIPEISRSGTRRNSAKRGVRRRHAVHASMPQHEQHGAPKPVLRRCSGIQMCGVQWTPGATDQASLARALPHGYRHGQAPPAHGTHRSNMESSLTQEPIPQRGSQFNAGASILPAAVHNETRFTGQDPLIHRSTFSARSASPYPWLSSEDP